MARRLALGLLLALLLALRMRRWRLELPWLVPVRLPVLAPPMRPVPGRQQAPWLRRARLRRLRLVRLPQLRLPRPSLVRQGLPVQRMAAQLVAMPARRQERRPAGLPQPAATRRQALGLPWTALPKRRLEPARLAAPARPPGLRRLAPQELQRQARQLALRRLPQLLARRALRLAQQPPG
jgi:hypothetical protein